ncbi:ethyl tert-butyl ether degradation protein EthD [Burkholderia cepacia JBK9]|uniref:Ethyl tert-butyl ether degradation protein EthD n=1 Tax=Burkholderia arboris TaxID=488730 RepID=A0A9Q9SLR5_9BURK|nr:EthD family reductase [Burkholderia arboris]ALX11481.1 ethyl tert-butyl ether degradation protein EthD [Burkholderia cepacia JBK9]MCA8491222.1 EthD family reductase [Burkholderia arboris]VWB99435.1 ethyl tert-butyl ether degradation protein EthD [Burkholderia arboris]
MIKVSVMYPYAAGARFDHAYYRESHMPMVKQRLGAACLYYTVDKGIAGGAPGVDPVYVAKCDFVCTSVEAFQAARDPHAQEIMADIANYTDIQPVLQISEVVVERSEV